MHITETTWTQVYKIILHSNLSHHHPRLLVLSLCIIESFLTFSPLLTLHWHLVYHPLLTDILAWRNKIHNAQTRRQQYIKLYARPQQPFVSKLLTISTWVFLKKMAQSIYGRGCGLDDPRFQFRWGRVFLSLPKRPKCIWVWHSLLVSMHWSSSSGIKRSGREPNNSSVSSTEVNILSTKVPLVLRFQLNEPQ